MNSTTRVEDIRYQDLNPEAQAYFKFTATTIVYMGVCWTCCVWQVLTAVELAYKVRKWLHYAVVFETVLAFLVITCSVLNPLTPVNCEVRFWISIVAVELGGCCIQSILLYKAYICYDRATWLVVIGSAINFGYIALIIIYGTLGNVPSHKDVIGNCVMNNLEWPALAKLGLDLASNTFLTLAFVLVIHRHYKAFGNSLYKTLLSGGLIFSVGVIISNVFTAILISTRAMGGLSADLYSFDWVITSYLLIKQFKSNKKVTPAPKPAEEVSQTAVERAHSPESFAYDGECYSNFDGNDKVPYTAADVEKGAFESTQRHITDYDMMNDYNNHAHMVIDVSRKNSFRINESTLGSSTLTTTASTITAQRDTKRSTVTTYIDSPALTFTTSTGYSKQQQAGDDELSLNAQPSTPNVVNSPVSHKIICQRCLAPLHGSAFPHHCKGIELPDDDDNH